MTDEVSMDIGEVMRYLPHRFPFLMVDKVIECKPGHSITAIKNVTINEPYFPGHFPGRPVMPGVVIIEALAQAAGILAFATAGIIPDETTKFYFVGIDKARFRKPVVPGDQLTLKAELKRAMRGIWRFSTVALVDSEVVCTADMLVTPGEGGQ